MQIARAYRRIEYLAFILISAFISINCKSRDAGWYYSKLVIDKTNLLTKVVLDADDNLLVGGRNILYRLDWDLEILEGLEVGPVMDNPGCYPEPATCPMGRHPTNNDVKVLLLYKKFVVVCGSVKQGACSLYYLANITAIPALSIGEPEKEVNQVGGRDSVVAFFDDKDRLYSAHTYDDRPNDVANFAISSRVIGSGKNLTLKYSFHSDYAISAVGLDSAFRQSYRIRYIHGFSYKGFSYFVTVQRTVPGGDTFESRLVRVCQEDPKFFSYTEVPIKCQKDTGDFNLATAAYIDEIRTSLRESLPVSPDRDESFLYITFAKSRQGEVEDPRKGSVLCEFNMTTVQRTFKTAVLDCFNGEPKSHQMELFLGTPVKCKAVTDYDPNKILCEPGSVNYIEGRERLPGQLKASFREVASSLFVTTQHNERIVFVGSRNGTLTKKSLKLNDPPVLYKVQISDTEIQPSIAADSTDENLFLLTGNQVVKFPIGSCKPYKDCQSCLNNLENDPLRCGWCGDHCAHEGECTTTKLQQLDCPPIINKIDPTTGPVKGGTNISISGENFGSSEVEGSISVYVGEAPCQVTLWKDKMIQCSTAKGEESISKVSVTVESFVNDGVFIKGNSTSDQEFRYLSPVFYGISPSFGPKSGGTNVSLIGEFLHIGYVRVVKLVGLYCKVISYNHSNILCQSGSAQLDHSHPVITGLVNLSIDGDCPHAQSSGDKNLHPYFKYLEDPFIFNVSPRATIKSGGTNITIRGQFLNHVAYPKLVVKAVSTLTAKKKELISDCILTPKSKGKEMICPTPPLGDSVSFSGQAPHPTLISFIMDGVEDLRNFSFTHNRIAELLYYPDPKYHKFKGERNIFKVPIDEPVIEIQGENLNSAHSKNDIRVVIQGGTTCNITKVTQYYLYCIVPQTSVPPHGNDTLRSVQVFAGPLHYQVGYIQFVDPEAKVALIVGITVGIVVIILAGLVAFYLYRKRRMICRNKNRFPTGYIVSFNNGEADSDIHRTFNEYSNHGDNRGDPRSGSNGSGEPLCSSGEAASGGIKVSDETMQLLEADDILYPRNYLTIHDVIGQGHFGRVYKGDLKLTDKEVRMVAVKTLHNCRSRNQEDIESFLQEGLMMKDFHHHHVLTMIGVCFEDNGFPMVILPYMANGDLLSYIRNEDNYPTVKDLLTFGIHIAEGMKYLSELKFVHRDLAARNCMIDEDKTLKVADFGLSRDIYERDYYSSDNKKSKLPVKWMAPESLEKGTYSNKSDCWSYGVVLWELMTRGVTPYPEVDNWEILNYVKSGRRMPQPSFCPEALYQVMLRCWKDEPKMRPGFGELAEEIKTIIQKMEAKNKHMRVGTKVTYVNVPDMTEDTPILNGQVSA